MVEQCKCTPVYEYIKIGICIQNAMSGDLQLMYDNSACEHKLMLTSCALCRSATPLNACGNAEESGIVCELLPSIAHCQLLQICPQASKHGLMQCHVLQSMGPIEDTSVSSNS